MYKIEAQVVVANYFADCEGSTELSISKLKTIKREIEETFVNQDQFLTVIIDENVIDSMLNSYPNYFSYDEEKRSILFNNNNLTTFYEDVFGIFNAQINHKIKFKFLSILENILEKEV